MAFKMNRPIIKGTASHKKSIAKATEPNNRTQADRGLIEQAYKLGRSKKPEKLDYKIESEKINLPTGKENEEIKGCTYEGAINYNPEATVDDGSCEYPDPETPETPETPSNNNDDDDPESTTHNPYEDPTGGNASASFNSVYEGNLLKTQGLGPREVDSNEIEQMMDALVFSSGQGVEILTPEQRKKIRNDFSNMKPSERTELLKQLKTSPAQKRDDRIYKNARANSTLRKNMRKSGYIPPELR